MKYKCSCCAKPVICIPRFNINVHSTNYASSGWVHESGEDYDACKQKWLIENPSAYWYNPYLMPIEKKKAVLNYSCRQIVIWRY